MAGCPGQNLQFRSPDKVIYYYPCPSCGSEIEFFYDDKKRPCKSCGEMVQPDLKTLMEYHTCASNCRSALECLGEEKYLQLVLGEWRDEKVGRSQLEEIIARIPQEEKGIKRYLKDTMDANIRSGYLLDTESDLEPLKKDGKYDLAMDILKEYVLGKRNDGDC